MYAFGYRRIEVRDGLVAYVSALSDVQRSWLRAMDEASDAFEHPVDDDREAPETGAQCGRCGSSVTRIDCPECEDGYEEYDYGDDVVSEINYRPCSVCQAKGGWYVCLSSPEWCLANPIPGRDDVSRGMIEEYECTGGAVTDHAAGSEQER